jgi:23S rRNA (adenine2503-C2)-methyltransferase
LYRSFYRDFDSDVINIPTFQHAPRLADLVSRDLATTIPHVEKTLQEDNVFKSVLRLSDGLKIEMVVIPMANHTTVCVSSQVGCAMDCRFCRTGRMGLRRDLSAAEMVSQVYLARRHFGFNVRNVVFMGMGEPLDNVDAVIQAIAVLSDQRGMDIARRHITVSTCGHVDGIRKLVALNWPDLKLAVSLNAPNDNLRETLMPVNRRYPLKMLRSALEAVPLARGNALFMEYVLIKGINDHETHAEQLAEFLNGLPVKLNLIPCNPCRDTGFQAPTTGDISRFHQMLIDRKIFVRLRSSKGAGILAACGQLGISDEFPITRRHCCREPYPADGRKARPSEFR